MKVNLAQNHAEGIGIARGPLLTVVRGELQLVLEALDVIRQHGLEESVPVDEAPSKTRPGLWTSRTTISRASGRRARTTR